MTDWYVVSPEFTEEVREALGIVDEDEDCHSVLTLEALDWYVGDTIVWSSVDPPPPTAEDFADLWLKHKSEFYNPPPPSISKPDNVLPPPPQEPT